MPSSTSKYSHTYPIQDLTIHGYLPRRSIPILSKTQLFPCHDIPPTWDRHRGKSLTCLEMPTQGGSRSTPVIPLTTFSPAEASHSFTHFNKSHQSTVYLTFPGSNWGKYSRFLLGSWYPEELPKSLASEILSPKSSDSYLYFYS